MCAPPVGSDTVAVPTYGDADASKSSTCQPFGCWNESLPSGKVKVTGPAGAGEEVATGMTDAGGLAAVVWAARPVGEPPSPAVPAAQPARVRAAIALSAM